MTALFMILIFKGYNDLSYWNSIDDLLHQQKQVKKKREREREYLQKQIIIQANRGKKKIEKDSIYCSGIFFQELNSIYMYILIVIEVLLTRIIKEYPHFIRLIFWIEN